MTLLFDSSTIEYYDRHHAKFLKGTMDVDMSALCQVFLKHIPKGGRILDLGCGSGRDTKYFVGRGYQVVALDASHEMVNATRSVADTEVHQIRFDEISFDAEFDGIWACASLLHVTKSALPELLKKCFKALRADGTMYVSFKHGDSERMVDGRLFTDLNQKSLAATISDVGVVVSVAAWITKDARPERATEEWLNAIITRSRAV
jgi:cyclopropane fatty-acyl-phospholipid synthase-like methyltransferase